MKSSRSKVSRLSSLLFKLLLVLALGLLSAVLIVREYVLPMVPQHSSTIAAAVERALGVPVHFESVSAQWLGLRPQVTIGGLSLLDEAGDLRLSVAEVKATLAWTSVLKFRPYFHLLVLDEPDLTIERDVQGVLRVAGMALPEREQAPAEAPESPALMWLLAQREMMVVNATVHWRDALRDEPPLVLGNVSFRLAAGLDRHRVGLSMTSEDGLFSALELRGEFVTLGLDGLRGRLYAAINGFDTKRLAQRVDLPVSLDTYGDFRGWLDFDGAKVLSATLDIALSELSLSWLPEQSPLIFGNPSGRVVFDGRSGQELRLRNFVFDWPDGAVMGPLDFDLRASRTLTDLQAGGLLKANKVALEQLARLIAGAQLNDGVTKAAQTLSPQGMVEGLTFEWQATPTPFSQWKLQADLSDVVLAPVGNLPGLRGLSGRLEGDQQQGRFRLTMRDGAVALPAVFPDPELMLDQARMEGGWQTGAFGLELFLDELRFANADTEGRGSGVYRVGVGKRGEIDLDVRLTRASATAVPAYLPTVLNAATREWLKVGLEGGHVPDARLRLRGRLDEFPFDNGEDGLFLVTARMVDAQLNYAPGWPIISNINGELRFEGNGMQISATRAMLSGVVLKDVLASIETLGDPDNRLLEIRGVAEGATQNFLQFIADSPVRAYIGGMTDGFKASGDGVLELAIDIPLEDISQATTRGEYVFKDNRLQLFDAMPELHAAAGRVSFTESSFAVPQATASFLSDVVTLSAPASSGGKPRFKVQGSTSMNAVNQWLDLPVLAHLSGTARWKAEIALLDGGVNILVNTDLEGVASSLPQPLNKRSAERWPAEFTLRILESGARRDLALDVSPLFSAVLFLRGTDANTRIERGGIALNTALDIKDQGIKLTARLDELDIDAWQRALQINENAEPGLPAWLSGVAMAVDFSANRVVLAKEVMTPFELGVLYDVGEGWRGQVSSDRVAGRFGWQPRGAGQLDAQLSHLRLGADSQNDTVQAVESSQPSRLAKLPAIDLKVDSFEWRGRKLGKLSLKAEVDEQYWRLRKLELGDSHGAVVLSGRWLMGGYPVTELDFSINSNNLGKWLANFGQDQVISRGKASAQGRLSWFGLPYRPDIGSLSGSLELEAEDGEFRQLEPGVGRLLGVLSLQALPRRLSLDFRDVFSDGFAFDQVSGSITVDGAVLMTDDLHIVGPAAKVWINGHADILRETQDLDVVVQPTLSETIAIGAAAGLLNPAAGLLALLAQRVLSDPVERMFAYHYHLSGSWAEPRVEKLPSPRKNKQQESR